MVKKGLTSGAGADRRRGAGERSGALSPPPVASASAPRNQRMFALVTRLLPPQGSAGERKEKNEIKQDKHHWSFRYK